MRATGGMSRRGFLRGVGMAGAGLALPAIVPSSILGANGAIPPSDKIVMGIIGTGSMGNVNMGAFLNHAESQVVAVCDLDTARRATAKQRVDDHYGNDDCAAYTDFRDMIGRGDLDAVVVATPDHWHAITAITALRAGLDVYGEKPFSHDLRAGRAMVDTVERYGRIWQTGSWQRSQQHFQHAAELVRNGRIGKIERVHVGLPTGGPIGPQPEMPVPDGFDYDFWLGPAPWAPYTEKRCHWNWRWNLDYGGGQMLDWIGHHGDIAHWGLGLEYAGPVEIEGLGDYQAEGLSNAAGSYHFTGTYANGLVMEVANAHPSTGFQMGAKWFGENGQWIHVSRGGLRTEPASLKAEEIGADETKLYESRDHQGNFLECVKSRRPTITPAEVAHRSASIGHLGQIAMLTGRKLRWNPETEEIIGDPAAEALLGRACRAPWHL